MRPLRYDAEIGGGNKMDKRSLDLEHAKEAWDDWEIHFLIILSLSLQFFLCLTADLRRRSASRVLSIFLWLAYLSADTVAVFVLGHLAVHAQGPRHELMLFWAPFVLIHLGGQDTITAFSKQDNELWTRHLLGLVTQTVLAGYVVSKSSWPDARLRAAVVLMFLCGFLKYFGRTYCLFSASPKSLRASPMTMSALWDNLSNVRDAQADTGHDKPVQFVKGRFEVMFDANKCRKFVNEQARMIVWVDDIMLMDAPVDDSSIIEVAEEIPDIVKEVQDRPDRSTAYEYVSASLVHSYQFLYTKASLLVPLFNILWYVGLAMPGSDSSFGGIIFVPIVQKIIIIFVLFALTYTLFQFISTVTALALFASAQKEGHYSKADITVSYILLVGAIVLDLLPTFMSIVSYVRKTFRPESVDECATVSYKSCLHPLGLRSIKQWSEELAQYSMTRRYTSSSLPGVQASMWKWILKCKPLLGAWCLDFLDLTGTAVTDDLKLFVLNKLLLQSRTQEWNFANSRGERTLGKWMESHKVRIRKNSGYPALHRSLSGNVEFSTSVLIWHIATEICCFSKSEGNGQGIGNDETRMMATTMERKKMRTRELSQYIMYLVFKCDVLLTSNSRLLHYKAHERLAEILSDQSATVNLDEKKAAIKVFDATKEQERNRGSSSGSGTHQAVQSTAEALYSPVLPRAYAVAQELIDIKDQAHRWELISEVWLEMLFYTAPRCGPDFHYEHLSTGGEFISHVLLLMRSLGPFMPKSRA